LSAVIFIIGFLVISSSFGQPMANKLIIITSNQTIIVGIHYDEPLACWGGSIITDQIIVDYKSDVLNLLICFYQLSLLRELIISRCMMEFI
jgi:hypothetical protein